MTISENKIQFYFFVTLFLAVIFLLVSVFIPFLSSIAIASVIAIIFKPLYKKILSAVKVPGLASLFTILIISLILIIPLSLLGIKIVQQVSQVSTTLVSGDFLTKVSLSVNNSLGYFKGVVPGINTQTDISIYVDKIYTTLLNGTFNNFSLLKDGTLGVAHGVISLLLTIIILYFLFKDGSSFKKKVIKYSPLSEDLDKKIIGRLELTINSIIRGAIFVALIQGFLAGLGMTIFGVPNSVLWGVAAAFGALIPGIGTSLVMIPAIIYLFLTASPIFSLGLLIWSIFIVGLIDNFLAPYLYAQGIKVHQVLILLAILGGLSVFGALGFIYGPLILSLFFTLLDMQKYFIAKK